MAKVCAHVTCPICQCVQRKTIDTAEYTYHGYMLVTCDIEVGGCDRPFILEFFVNVDVTPHAIEGIQPPDRL